MTRLAINGFFYNIEVWGDLSGYPVVLLHGFSGANSSWQPLVSTATLESLCLIAVELPGHGQSDSPEDPQRYSLEQVSDDLARLLDTLNIEQAVVIGYSMGGRVALHFATVQKKRVAALLLLSASPGLATEDERAARRQSDTELAELIEREGIEAFVNYWEKLPLWDSQQNLPAETRDNLRTQRLQNNPRGLANSLRGAGTGQQPSLWEKLAGLNLPTLLIAGDLDSKFHDLARQMQRAIPNAIFRSVRNAGHAVHLENPAFVSRAILDFLEGKDIASFTDWGWRGVAGSFYLLLAGPPATGKTALGKHFAQIFRLPFLSKDIIKEHLFDQLGSGDQETSARYSLASWAILYDFMRAQLAANVPFVVESTFQNERDKPKLADLTQLYAVRPIQIQCVADGQTLYQRFVDRADQASRHPGHVDSDHEWLKADLLRGRYDPLEIEGMLLEVDTTNWEKLDYDSLGSLIQLAIEPPGVIPF